MSVSSRRTEFATALLVAATLAHGARAQNELASVREPFDRGRFGEALAHTADIGDASLRAQWRYYIRNAAGDLVAALDGTLADLGEHPDDAALLANAAVGATTLGRGEFAEKLCDRWRAALEHASLEPAQRTAALARADEVGKQAHEAADVERAARRALRSARAVAITLLALSCIALFAFARWNGARRPG